MDAYERMQARRRGEERVYLHVAFLKAGSVEKERILEEHYACTAMSNWLSKGTEYNVRNHPVKLPRSGVAGAAMRSRHFRANAAKVASLRS
jgi:hypothetical protein